MYDTPHTKVYIVGVCVYLMETKREQQIRQLGKHLRRKKLDRTNMKELIIFTMANCSVSRRTAREYLEVALFMDE